MYNVTLIIILVMMIMAAFGAAGNMFIATYGNCGTERKEAQMMAMIDLLFVAVFAWWAYYEYNSYRNINVNIYLKAKKIKEMNELDPNIKSAYRQKMAELGQPEEDSTTESELENLKKEIGLLNPPKSPVEINKFVATNTTNVMGDTDAENEEIPSVRSNFI